MVGMVNVIEHVESLIIGELFTVFQLTEVGEGSHNFTIIASDADGTTVRALTIFESKVITIVSYELHGVVLCVCTTS